MRGPAQQPGEVLDRGVVAVHRIRDVHPHAAVQVMADLHRRRRLRCHPVPEDAQIISRIQILGQSPDHRLGHQVNGARGDVNLGELRGHGLKVDSGLPNCFRFAT